MNKASPELLQAIAVTSELCATVLSEPAARVMASDLSLFPEHQVMAALRRCRRELRSQLTLAAILERIEDGRPGPEEAWAQVKSAIGDEGVTVVWTPEMKEAFFVACQLEDDHVAARMAFLERYRVSLQTARSEGRKITWEVCLGHAKSGRDLPVLHALEKGRITHKEAQSLLPDMQVHDPEVLRLARDLAAAKRLPKPGDDSETKH